jgi:hypothetical protein
MQRNAWLSFAALSLLCACAYQDARVAEKAQQSLIGTSVADLDMCAGLPTKTERINPATELRSYERDEATKSGLNITFPVIGGGMEIGAGGYCHATFKMVDGHVTALKYAGETAVVGAEGAVCAPIVRSCVTAQAQRE